MISRIRGGARDEHGERTRANAELTHESPSPEVGILHTLDPPTMNVDECQGGEARLVRACARIASRMTAVALPAVPATPLSPLAVVRPDETGGFAPPPRGGFTLGPKLSVM